jgi:GT2 family glycosyltransferase
MNSTYLIPIPFFPPYFQRVNTTIVICSKDRKTELRRCLQNCLLQSNSPQILVVDDGSTDGTALMVRDEFPMVQIHQLTENVGLINARNFAANLVQTKFICSIDDDAFFSHPDIVFETEKRFDHSEIAAVAIPVIQVHEGHRLHQSCAPGTMNFTRQFIGTAHMVDVSVFRAVGGYASYLYRQEEELDFAIRLFRSGYKIRTGWGAPIIHEESTLRNESLIRFYEARNHLIIILRYTPFFWIPVHAGGNAVNLFRNNPKEYVAIFKGYVNGVRSFWQLSIPREPLSWNEFLSFRALGRSLLSRKA